MEPVLKGVVFFVLVTKMLSRGRKVLKKVSLSCTFDSPGLKTEEKRSRNRQVLCSLGKMPNYSELQDTDGIFVGNLFPRSDMAV